MADLIVKVLDRLIVSSAGEYFHSMYSFQIKINLVQDDMINFGYKFASNGRV